MHLLLVQGYIRPIIQLFIADLNYLIIWFNYFRLEILTEMCTNSGQRRDKDFILIQINNDKYDY